MAVVPYATAQPVSPSLGGNFSSLEPRRQQLVDDWVARFNVTTGQKVEAGPFYDEIISLSAKVTFDAVTNALMQSTLTDDTGASLGDALSLVERVDTVHGQLAGAPGDLQFRMYVRLTEQALATLDRSSQFKRRADNTIFHKGYPLNYRAQGGAPSIQISIALDRRRADVDVDYRSATFPLALFNGHLSSANSDVRAGNNYDRHVNRWVGFQSWWRGFFGVRLERAPDEADRSTVLAATPRAGKKAIEVMANDFLTAWLVEGDVAAAMGYISQRSYACLAESSDQPEDVDRGMAPFKLMIGLKAAREALGTPASLEGIARGVRLSSPSLKVVQQPHHAQFVVYSVPDDLAAGFDCENRLLADPKPVRRAYGTYYGTIFFIRGNPDNTVALLWAQEDGYWKIVSWQTGFEVRAPSPPDAAPNVRVARIAADHGFADAARGFLESWLIRRDYNGAFQYLSERSYACYDLMRGPEQPAATSAADAGQKIRAGMERVGSQLAPARNLNALISPVDPVHPAVRLMDHANSRVFTLTSVTTELADAAECSSRARGESFKGATGSEYGTVFGMSFRFRSKGGDAPVLRTLWRHDNGNWRITAYDIEVP